MCANAAVITVSDRASRGEYADRSGPLACALLREHGFTCGDAVVVPDEADDITSAIRNAVEAGARLVLTTGGTGVGPRDVTPEATAALGGQQLPGLAEAIRRRGADATPMAVLSRGLATILRDGDRSALVVNAPGSTGGVRDAVSVLATVADHVLSQLDGGDH